MQKLVCFALNPVHFVYVNCEVRAIFDCATFIEHIVVFYVFVAPFTHRQRLNYKQN